MTMCALLIGVDGIPPIPRKQVAARSALSRLTRRITRPLFSARARRGELICSGANAPREEDAHWTTSFPSTLGKGMRGRFLDS